MNPNRLGNCIYKSCYYYTSGSGDTAVYRGPSICDYHRPIECDAGYYEPLDKTNALSDFTGGQCVGADYYSAAGITTRTPCPAGTKSGSCGANAGSCVPYMTLKNSKNANAPVLLKGVKGNSPKHLCVKSGNDVYSGNLVTTSVTGAVKLNIGGTTYYLTDNSTQ
jgi:hypothetical protein